METLVISKATLVKDIKKMSEEQRFYKNQRKTVHIVGERKMPAWEAAHEHEMNREDLRAMYAVYGLSKGKTFSEIENTFPEENHPLHELQWKIDKLMDKYKPVKEKVLS